MSREWARMRRRSVSIPERKGVLALWPVPVGLGPRRRRIGLIGITMAIFPRNPSRRFFCGAYDGIDAEMGEGR